MIIIINLVFSILGQAVSSRGAEQEGGGLRARIVFSWAVFQRKVFCRESYFQVQFFHKAAFVFKVFSPKNVFYQMANFHGHFFKVEL